MVCELFVEAVEGFPFVVEDAHQGALTLADYAEITDRGYSVWVESMPV